LWAYSTPPLHYVFLFHSSLIIQFLFLFFVRLGVSLSRGLSWFIPELSVGILCVTYLLTCWSAGCLQEGLELASGGTEPSCFLSVTWCGEALYGLGVQGVKFFILLGAFILPTVAPATQQNFWFMELLLSASVL
jgi:hypothetical protein